MFLSFLCMFLACIFFFLFCVNVIYLSCKNILARANDILNIVLKTNFRIFIEVEKGGGRKNS